MALPASRCRHAGDHPDRRSVLARPRSRRSNGGDHPRARCHAARARVPGRRPILPRWSPTSSPTSRTPGALPPAASGRRRQGPPPDRSCRSGVPRHLTARGACHGIGDRNRRVAARRSTGFVKLIGPHHVAFADLSGNNRLDSYGNIVEHPHVGMLFLVPGVGETLRINGRAAITTDPEVLAATAIDGVQPKVAVLVEVDECYIHCAKALRRSGVWDPATWLSPEDRTSGRRGDRRPVPARRHRRRRRGRPRGGLPGDPVARRRSLTSSSRLFGELDPDMILGSTPGGRRVLRSAVEDQPDGRHPAGAEACFSPCAADDA